MNKPNGYDAAQATTFEGGGMPLPGAYVLGIISAECKESRSGNEMLVLSLDIVEGQYKNNYRNLGERLKKDCLLKHYRVTDTEQSLPYFKGDIKAIEESNPGFKFNFDEKTLRGKYVGGMLREEEYEKSDGTIATVLKIAFLCSVEKVKSGTLVTPKKKEFDGYVPHQSTSTDDLPF